MQNGTVSLQQTFSDVAMDKTGGALTKNVNANGIKSAENQLDRAQRVAAGDPTSSGRAQTLFKAEGNLYNQQVKASVASETTSNGLQETSNAVRRTSTGTPIILVPQNRPAVDNTRVVRPLFIRN